MIVEWKELSGLYEAFFAEKKSTERKASLLITCLNYPDTAFLFFLSLWQKERRKELTETEKKTTCELSTAVIKENYGRLASRAAEKEGLYFLTYGHARC